MRVVLLTLLLLAAQPAFAHPTVIKFDVPGAKNTRATAVSASGFVAGNYDPSGAEPCNQCGFLRTPDGTVTPFSVFDAAFVYADAVGNSGVVVGQYLTADFQRRAYIRTPDGVVTQMAIGDLYDISAINDSGIVTGDTLDGSRETGFLRAPDGTLTHVKIAKCRDTELTGINAAGVASGNCSARHMRGFLRMPDGTLTMFVVPHSLRDQDVLKIDDSDAVAGWYSDRTGFPHGFIRDADGTFHKFHLPPLRAFGVQGMATVDGDRQVVGDFETPDSHWLGFIRHEDGRFQTFDVAASGEGSGGTQTNGIAASGMVAGSYSDDGLTSHGYVRMP